MSGRVCPWSSWAEWSAVRDSLLGQDATAATAAAVERVVAWRRRGRLPLGVDITSSLVHTCLHDPVAPRHYLRPQLRHNVEPASEASLQSEYSLTLIRFVNGVSDSIQKGKVATSVSKHAEHAGLHPMLVDIRHEATHNSLPSLHTLRLAAAHALAWLEQNYWHAQAGRLEECSTDAANLVLKLVENQAARLAFSTRQSSDCSSDSEDTAEMHVGLVSSGDAPSAAVLKKQQRSLLGDLKQVVPTSQPATLAAAVLSCNILELEDPASASSMGSPSPQKRTQQRSLGSKKLKRKASSTPADISSQLQPALISTLAALDSVWCFCVRYVVTECTTALVAVKRFILSSIASPQALEPACLSPAAAHAALAWLSAALKVCEDSSEPCCGQQTVQYTLQQLFEKSSLFPGIQTARNQPQKHQQQDEDGYDLSSLAQLYCSSSANVDEQQNGDSVGRKRGAQPDESTRPEVLERGSAWASVASSLTTLEQGLCITALKAPEDSPCHRLCKLASFVLSHFANSNTEQPPSTQLLPLSQASPATSFQQPGEADFLLQLQTMLSQTQMTSIELQLRRTTPAAIDPLRQTSQEQQYAHSAAVMAEHNHNRASAMGTLSAAPDCQQDKKNIKRRRVHVAEGWLGCPIGTLPTCITGVGQLPELTNLRHTPALAAIYQSRLHEASTITTTNPAAPQAIVRGVMCQNGVHVQSQARHVAQQLWPQTGSVPLEHSKTTHTGCVPIVGNTLQYLGASSPVATVPAGVGVVGSEVPESAEAIAQRDVATAWDSMLGDRRVQMGRLVTGMVQQFAAVDRSVDVAGEKSSDGLELYVNSTVGGILQGLNCEFPNESLQMYVGGDVGEERLMNSVAAGVVGQGGRVDASIEGMSQNEYVGGVAGSKGKCTADKSGFKPQPAGIWSEEIEAQVQGMGLLQPLLQCCAAEVV